MPSNSLDANIGVVIAVSPGTLEASMTIIDARAQISFTSD